MSDWLTTLYEAKIDVAGYPLLWREIIGNLFGFASAIGGMRRRVWAWPIGIVGNLILFTVFFSVAVTTTEGRHPLLGQAARQVFFIITSVYGWWVWNRTRSALRARRVRSGENDGGAEAPAVVPRWATGRERVGYVVFWLGAVVVAQWVFAAVGAGWPAPRWYYWCDAWIFVGSIVATYAMARGWNDFWLAWIAVDLVGVPLLWHSEYYPSAVLYGVYSLVVLWGFVVWVRVTRRERPASARGLVEGAS